MQLAADRLAAAAPRRARFHRCRCPALASEGGVPFLQKLARTLREKAVADVDRVFRARPAAEASCPC